MYNCVKKGENEQKMFHNKQYKINETKKHITRDVRWRLNFDV